MNDDNDRFFIKQSETWRHLKRLGINYVNCAECDETDPRCFIGKLGVEKRQGNTLTALCERCRRKKFAPKDRDSIEDKWTALHKAGVKNTRCHCGEDDPFAFEADHIAGRKSSSAVLGVCINCHLKRTSRQLTEYPPDDFDPENPIVIARNTVRGMIEHLELFREHLRVIEKFLHTLAADDHSPPQEQ